MTDEPIDDYLWNRFGEADDQLRRLESLLVRHRFNRPLAPRPDEATAEADDEPEP